MARDTFFPSMLPVIGIAPTWSVAHEPDSLVPSCLRSSVPLIARFGAVSTSSHLPAALTGSAARIG